MANARDTARGKQQMANAGGVVRARHDTEVKATKEMRRTTSLKGEAEIHHIAEARAAVGFRRAAETSLPAEPLPKRRTMLTHSSFDPTKSKSSILPQRPTKSNVSPVKPSMITRSSSVPTKLTLD
jgi:hypothetical protein